MAFSFGKASLAPVVTIVSSLKNSLPIIPISENVTSHIVGIDILRILEPFMMKNL